MPAAIPVLDLEPLHEHNDRNLDALARAFLTAYGEHGFAYVVNHGIDQDQVERIFAASRQFHALPRSSKQAIALDHNHRGYIAPAASTEVNSAFESISTPNRSESFIVMREDSADAAPVRNGDYLAGANQWPDLPGFRQSVEDWIAAVAPLAGSLVALAFRAVGSTLDAASHGFDLPTTWLRLVRYDPCPGGPRPGQYGSAPHTDFGCITVLAQDDTGGLEVMSPDGRWIGVPPLPGSLVVNVGDMLRRWSNGRLRSTPHRVQCPRERERYSCAYFHDPNVNAWIRPLPECVDRDRPEKFAPVRFGDFLRTELESSYVAHAPGGERG